MAAQPRPEPQAGEEQAAVEEREAPGRADPQQAAEHAVVVADLEDRWRRALADLDNLRKRYARERERGGGAERGRGAAQWLPVVDDLDRALAHAAEDPSAVLEGVRAVRDHATAVLARLGYPRYEEVGGPSARAGGTLGCAGARARGHRPAGVRPWPATTTRSSGSRARPAPRSCSRPTGGCAGVTTPTANRTGAPESGSRT